MSNDTSNMKPGPGGGPASFLGNLDFDAAKDEAAKHAGSSGDKDMFSNILSLVGQKQHKIAEEDVDEEGGSTFPLTN